MTNQQMQYAYWQRMRQLQTYRAYVGGSSTANKNKKNAYTTISKITDDYFLNYFEYNPKNIDPQNAVKYLKDHEDPIFAAGRCTGVYEKNSGKVLRQLDWYYNNEAEFIIKMNADTSKGVFASIGTTAASPKMTADIAKHYITTGEYYDYFDVLPFFTVDGVNENGIFAQSNVVNKNDVEININAGDPTKTDCCIVMVVRYILDKFAQSDMTSATAVHDKLFNNLHIYGTSKLGDYNSHILVACQALKKSYVIEFTATDIVVNEFAMMTNFRTFNTIEGEPKPIRTYKDYQELPTSYWGDNNIESNGIGLERWNATSRFIRTHKYDPASIEEFKQLRKELNYTHAYTSSDQFVEYQTWLTDNLSGTLTIEDMASRHLGDTSKMNEINSVLNGYMFQFNNRSRLSGEGLYTNTWHTTHSTIYDLVNLSCNVETQQNTTWNILSDGTFTEDVTETLSGKWVMIEPTGKITTEFIDYDPNQKRWYVYGNSMNYVQFSTRPGIPIPEWRVVVNGMYQTIVDTTILHDPNIKSMNIIDPNTQYKYSMVWVNE